MTHSGLGMSLLMEEGISIVGGPWVRFPPEEPQHPRRETHALRLLESLISRRRVQTAPADANQKFGNPPRVLRTV